MSKPWLGYVAAGLFILAGIFQVIGEKPWMGVLFIAVGIANIFIQVKLNKLRNGSK